MSEAERNEAIQRERDAAEQRTGLRVRDVQSNTVRRNNVYSQVDADKSEGETERSDDDADASYYNSETD